MNKQRQYPSKVLLLGEYTVLLGGHALAVPFHTYSGKWCEEPFHGDIKKLIHDWVKYLKGAVSRFPVAFDVDDFEKELDAGLGFCSDIPIGYGLGSSGALTAAVWDRYGRSIDDMDELQKILSVIESFFHGKSSGLDPLVSLADRPVLSGRKTEFPDPECWHKFKLRQHLFLWNSGAERSTASLVQNFTEELRDYNYHSRISGELVPANEAAINAMISNDSKSFDRAWRKISELQLELFSKMIPDTVRKIWRTGLEKNHFFFKLCGAGGGGYFLVYAPQVLAEDVRDKKEFTPLHYFSG